MSPSSASLYPVRLTLSAQRRLHTGNTILLSFASRWSDPCLLLWKDSFNFAVNSGQFDFQHVFSLVSDQADRYVALAE